MAEPTTQTQTAPVDWMKLFQAQLDAQHRETEKGQKMIAEHAAGMKTMLDSYRSKMFRRDGEELDPRMKLPKEQKDMLESIDRALMQFPMLMPYVVNYINTNLQAVANATQQALGPLPQQAAPNQ